MFKAIIHNRLKAFGRDYGYDTSYARELADIDLSAFLRFGSISAISSYTRDAPVDAQFAAKIVGTMGEDCGPCTQLMITMAERAGVNAETLRAIVQRDDAALGPDALLAVRYTRAVMQRDPAADVLREEIVARWGRRAVVTLAFGLIAARVYPTLKYALGYGKLCQRVVVDGAPVAVTRGPSEVRVS